MTGLFYRDIPIGFMEGYKPESKVVKLTFDTQAAHHIYGLELMFFQLEKLFRQIGPHAFIRFKERSVYDDPKNKAKIIAIPYEELEIQHTNFDEGLLQKYNEQVKEISQYSLALDELEKDNHVLTRKLRQSRQYIKLLVGTTALAAIIATVTLGLGIFYGGAINP